MLSETATCILVFSVIGGYLLCMSVLIWSASRQDSVRQRAYAAWISQDIVLSPTCKE